jgi:hypothetical protein
MSHFTVMVVGEDVEKQLEPFWGLDLSEEELKKDPRAKFEVEIKAKDVEKEFAKYKKNRKGDDPSYKSIEEWIEDWHGYYPNEKGDYGYYHNPNAKWDWFETGGRWTGLLKLKSGAKGKTGRPGLMTSPAEEGYVDSALKKDIDWESMREESREAAIEEWKRIKKETKKEDPFYARVYGIRKNDTEKTYAKRHSDFSVFAILKDGKWYEKGVMGKVGCVSNEKSPNKWKTEFNEIFDSIKDNERITIVDCHI